MLKELLEQKKCFKLICGAGNENLQEVERLVALYASAGCHFFDLSASEEVLAAAQRGLDFSIPKSEQKDYHFCLSIGTKNDAHFNKARINPEKCKRCEQCIKACPRIAISPYFKVVEKNCIGCLKCKSACKHAAIEIYQKNRSIEALSNIVSPLVKCVELHVSDLDSASFKWGELCSNFYEMLSICIGRTEFSDEQIADILPKLVAKRPPYSVIIQADGNSISGGEDNFETTLPAVEMGEFVKSLNLPVYLIFSGGTNSKTAELARSRSLDFNGVGIGSFARKIVKEYIDRDDFFKNEGVFNEALGIAKSLVDSVI